MDSNDKLKLGFQWSLAIHGIFFLFLFVFSYIVPAPPLRITPSLRVDLVGLPDVLKKDLKNPSKSLEEIESILKKAETEIKSQPKPKEMAEPDEMVVKPKVKEKEKSVKREKMLKSALARIKALAKIQAEEKEESSPLLKGNLLSKGTSLSGDAKESMEENYFDTIRNRLQDYWSLPVWIARQNLNAKVSLYLDARGRLIRFEFVEASGNSQFDAAVKRTIQQSQPFPPPPKEISASLRVHGILVGFPL